MAQNRPQLMKTPRYLRNEEQYIPVWDGNEYVPAGTYKSATSEVRFLLLHGDWQSAMKIADRLIDEIDSWRKEEAMAQIEILASILPDSFETKAEAELAARIKRLALGQIEIDLGRRRGVRKENA